MAETELRARLAAEGLQASAWGNGPGDVYAEHRHADDKVLVAAAGSITFHLPELGRDVLLATGDRLELPQGTLHGATVGSAGVTCLEAHLPGGSLDGAPRHLAGWAETGD
jgi:uncharacterized protein YjlB